MAETLDPSQPMRLRPRGIGRLFTGAFLTVWLCGWAAGECAALWALISGAVALLSGRPIHNGAHPMSLVVALGIGTFLLFWLSMWTLGGVMAMRELLRMIWAEDRFSVTPEGLEVEHQIGPFRSRQVLRNDQLRALQVRRPMRSSASAAIVMETATGMVELSRLGTSEERDQVATRLRQQLRLDEPRAESTPTLPEGWQEIVTPEGMPVLVTSPRTRAAQTRVGGLIAFALATLAAALVRESVQRPGILPVALLFTGLAIFAIWGVIWLARERMEWRIGSGRIVLQRRFGASVSDQFTAESLELTSTRDSDSDEWYALDAVGADAAGKPGRKRLHRTMTDPTVPRHLGAWLAMRASMPYADHAGGSERTLELTALISQLEQSGPLGKFAARFLGQMAKRSGMTSRRS